MATTRKNKRFLLFLLLITSLLLIVGCSDESNESNAEKGGKDEAENAAPQSGGAIRVGVSEEPDTLDIHKTAMGITSQISSHLGGALLTMNPETREIEPHLAESYTVSEDGKTLTFKIRQDVVMQDGTAITATVFKETFDRILNPETGAATVASMLGGVQSVSAPDDETLVIQLEAPSAPLLQNLADASFLQPLSMAAIEEAGDDYGRNPVGVGPWKFNEWVTGQSISLVRNEGYKWPETHHENQGKAYPDSLEYKFIGDNQTLLAALDSGSIDIAYEVTARDAKRYRERKGFHVVEADMQGLGLFMQMNLENEILADVNVRKAINMAINKESIIDAVLDGEGTPAYGPLASSIFGYDPNVEEYGHKFNAEEAIELLESSGWEQNGDGVREKDGQELKFELSTMEDYNQSAQIAQAMLKEIGIEVSIQAWDAGTLIENVSQGDFELSFLTYAFPDPDILYLLFHSSQIGGLNHVRVNDPELDALLEKGRITLDADERKQVYADIQEIVVEEAYWVPIYTNKLLHIVNDRVHNVSIVDSTMVLHDSWVTPE